MKKLFKIYKKLDLIISLLNLILIYIIHKILVLVKNHLNNHKDN